MPYDFLRSQPCALLGIGWTCLTYPRKANSSDPYASSTYKIYVAPDGARFKSFVKARAYADGPYCVACGSGDDPEGNDILLCDTRGCMQAWHMKCLREPLDAVPDGNWYCPECMDRGPAQPVASPSKRSPGIHARQLFFFAQDPSFVPPPGYELVPRPTPGAADGDAPAAASAASSRAPRPGATAADSSGAGGGGIADASGGDRGGGGAAADAGGGGGGSPSGGGKGVGSRGDCKGGHSSSPRVLKQTFELHPDAKPGCIMPRCGGTCTASSEPSVLTCGQCSTTWKSSWWYRMLTEPPPAIDAPSASNAADGDGQGESAAGAPGAAMTNGRPGGKRKAKEAIRSQQPKLPKGGAEHGGRPGYSKAHAAGSSAAGAADDDAASQAGGGAADDAGQSRECGSPRKGAGTAGTARSPGARPEGARTSSRLVEVEKAAQDEHERRAAQAQRTFEGLPEDGEEQTGAGTDGNADQGASAKASSKVGARAQAAARRAAYDDCRVCTYCLDRKKYGGPGRLKRACAAPVLKGTGETGVASTRTCNGSTSDAVAGPDCTAEGAACAAGGGDVGNGGHDAKGGAGAGASEVSHFHGSAGGGGADGGAHWGAQPIENS